MNWSSASCDGNVTASLPGGAKLTADHATFDALAQLVEVSATENRFVYFTEPNDPVAKPARKITWDVRKQQPRVFEPAPVVVPR